MKLIKTIKFSNGHKLKLYLATQEVDKDKPGVHMYSPDQEDLDREIDRAYSKGFDKIIVHTVLV